MKRIIVALTFSLLGGVAIAHHTGHESRTVADCEKLPGTQKEGMRSACLACVTRPKPHHFHPDDVKGERCNPNDGEAH